MPDATTLLDGVPGGPRGPRPAERNLAQEAAAGSEYIIHLLATMDETDRHVAMANLLNCVNYFLLDFGRANERHSRQRRVLYQAAITCANLRDATLKSTQNNYDGELFDWGLGDLASGGLSDAERRGVQSETGRASGDVGVPGAGANGVGDALADGRG
jgi:hypothetical protein